MQPASREQLKDYCLRRLGFPVIEINVDPDQLEDRIDDAMYYYTQFHMDATDRYYFKYEMTSNDITNRYITVDDSIISVIRMIRLGGFGATKGNIFDFRYQYALNDLYTFGSTMSIVGYQMTRDYLSMIEFIFNQEKLLRFNRHQQRIYIDLDWQKDVNAGDYLIFETYKVIDPNTFTKVYNDKWLKDYVTALFKKQWGDNIKKYDGVSLPGGVKLNGQKIYDEAVTEIQKLEEECQKTYQLPVNFFIG